MSFEIQIGRVKCQSFGRHFACRHFWAELAVCSLSLHLLLATLPASIPWTVFRM